MDRATQTTPNPDATWRGLAREAALAAEHLAIGATAIGRARSDRVAFYAQAFFALSVGLERSAKLALALDRWLEKGQFPTGAQLRDYGHNLRRLLGIVEAIRDRRGFVLTHGGLPSSEIHDAVVTILTDFATNLTRYYNLELLAAGTQGLSQDDPIASWYREVTLPVLDLHYSKQRAERDGERAVAADQMMGPVASIYGISETGETIRTVADAVLRSLQAEAARPWERMYVMQLARFLGAVIVQLANLARSEGLAVPVMVEFFYIFEQNDSYFRSRKTWSLEASR